MVWQDVVIFVANLLFTYSLGNQVVHGFRKKKGFLTLQTASLTTIGLYSMAIAFFSLSFIFSAVILTINATFWLILLVQRIKYGKA